MAMDAGIKVKKVQIVIWSVQPARVGESLTVIKFEVIMTTKALSRLDWPWQPPVEVFEKISAWAQ